MPIFVSEPPALGLAYRAPLLTGEAGTDQTVKLMRQLVDAALADASFVRKAVDIVRSVPAYDEFGELEALYEWAKSNIRFTKDPLTKEKLYPPQELLKIRAGDCDDISMLLGSFALALGYPARLITISANPDAPQEFSHVYVQAEAPVGSGQWVSMDAARADSQFGVDPPVYFRKRAWSLTEDAYQDLSGIAKARRPFGLGSYGYVGLGDENAPPADYSPILSQSIAEIPTIISAVAGRPSSAATPYGQYSTSSPYGSFMTPYSPGWGLPAAGYTAGTPYGSGLSSEGGVLPLLLIAGLVLMMSRKS